MKRTAVVVVLAILASLYSVKAAALIRPSPVRVTPGQEIPIYAAPRAPIPQPRYDAIKVAIEAALADQNSGNVDKDQAESLDEQDFAIFDLEDDSTAQDGLMNSAAWSDAGGCSLAPSASVNHLSFLMTGLGLLPILIRRRR